MMFASIGGEAWAVSLKPADCDVDVREHVLSA